MDKYRLILEVDENAGSDEIKKAYRRLAKLYHPDVNNSPNANQKFIEITEAYENLLHPKVAATHQTHYQEESYKQSSYQEEKRRQKAEAQREKELKIAMEYEKTTKETQFLKEVGLYNLLVLLLWMKGAFAIGLLLVVIPSLICIFVSYILIVLMFPLILGGIWILNYVYKHDTQKEVKPRFDFSKWNIDFWQKSTDEYNGEECWFCKGEKADAKPYRFMLFKLKNNGKPLVEENKDTLSYNRKLRRINIPRSRKAFVIHTIASALKIISIIGAELFIDMQSVVWRLIIGIFVGGVASSALFLVSRTRSKSRFLLNATQMLRIAIILMLIALNTRYYMGDYYLKFDSLVVAIVLFLLFELFANLIITVIPQSYFNQHFYPPYPKADELYKTGFQMGHGLPFVNFFYPLYKWLF